MTRPTGNPPGGKRPGAGRPRGARGKAVIAREMAQKNIVDETLARLTKEEIERLTPVQVMELAMHLMIHAGNMSGAVGVAEKLAPYTHAKIASVAVEQTLPADIAPDVPPSPDEPGPTNPIW